MDRPKCLFAILFIATVGEYHQYDNIIYPKKQSQHVVVKYIQRSWNYVMGSSTKESELVIPSHESMQSTALEIYLEQYLTRLKTTSLTGIQASVMEITNIFQLLNKPEVFSERKNVWHCQELSKVSLLEQPTLQTKYVFCNYMHMLNFHRALP